MSQAAGTQASANWGFPRIASAAKPGSMSQDPNSPAPPPPPLMPILLVIIGVDLFIIGVLSFTGALQRLSPSAQFMYGMTTFAFPVIVYVLLKRRRD